MEAQNPFAAVTFTPDVIAARVLNELGRDCEQGRFDPCPQEDALRRVAAASVDDLWVARVKTFVPLLALREAREVLRHGETAD